MISLSWLGRQSWPTLAPRIEVSPETVLGDAFTLVNNTPIHYIGQYLSTVTALAAINATVLIIIADVLSLYEPDSTGEECHTQAATLHEHANANTMIPSYGYIPTPPKTSDPHT